MNNNRRDTRRSETDSRSPKPLLHHKASSNRRSSAPALISVPPVQVAVARQSLDLWRGPRHDCPSHVDDVQQSANQRPQERRRNKRPSSPQTSVTHQVAAMTSDQELPRELCELLIQHDARNGHIRAEHFLHANLDPPVTKTSMAELHIASIIGNFKLRHDINFDRELHFRPNQDGPKGRLKRTAQAEYWSALEAELQLYTIINSQLTSGLDHAHLERLRAASSRRLPNMLEAVRDILKVLVPPHDHSIIDTQLDVVVIMQEVKRGICDISRIARWLSGVLKAHCAPMRDSMIDKMVASMDAGIQQGQAQPLVEGLFQLFVVMEAMKLDVANHQIRHLRLPLIEDTIKFEQKHHCNRIRQQRLDPHSSRLWFTQQASTFRSLNTAENVEPRATNPLYIFLNGFLTSLFCPVPIETLPETFNLDMDRILALKAEIHDHIGLSLCEKVYLDLSSSASLGFIANIPARQSLRSAVSQIVRHGSSCANWYESLEHIAAEMVRHVCSQYAAGVSSDRQHQLRQTAGDALRRHFLSPYRASFWAYGSALRDEVLPLVMKKTEAHLNASPVDIFNAFVPPGAKSAAHRKQPLAHLAVQPRLTEDFVLDAVQRISHIAVLHWRIWSPLVYLYKPKTAATPFETVGTDGGRRAEECAAHGQPLSSKRVSMQSGSEEAGKKELTVSEVGVPEASVSDVSISGAHDTASMTDDPSSQVLYKQRTN